MALEDFRDLLDQKRVSVGGNRAEGRGPMQNAQARRYIRKQREKGKLRTMGRGGR